MRDVHSFFDAITLFFYPRRCAVCGDLIPAGDLLCAKCAKEIHLISEEFCTKCGNLKQNCECKKFVFHFAGCASAFRNRDAAQKCMYDFKIFGKLDRSRFLAIAMAQCVRRRFSGVAFDCVCCVPMFPKKKRAKGFNQSEILAKALAKQLALPYVPKALQQVKAGLSQHTLNARDRFDNVKGLYACAGNFSGKTVLLVDDIKTTGATLDECARQLRLAGAKAVLCVTALVSG